MRTLYAGRNPPSAIFITRAWASVVEARAGLSDGLRLSCNSSTVAIAASTRHREHEHEHEYEHEPERPEPLIARQRPLIDTS